jgi:hypothetical protein
VITGPAPRKNWITVRAQNGIGALDAGVHLSAAAGGVVFGVKIRARSDDD